LFERALLARKEFTARELRKVYNGITSDGEFDDTEIRTIRQMLENVANTIFAGDMECIAKVWEAYAKPA